VIAFVNRKALLATFEPLSSPIDWCEENYKVHPQIVEFWNSLSSFALFIAAFVAPRFICPDVHEHEPKLWMIWASMACVGIGSVTFHATLSVAGQILDELPICMLSMFGVFMIRPLHKWNASLRETLFSGPVFVGTLFGSTLACLLFPVLSHVFCVSWMPILLYTYASEYMSSNSLAKKHAKGMFTLTLTFFAGAFTCWLLDRFSCERITSIFGYYPQLHAWWHVLISFTFWCAVITGIILRCEADGLKVRLKPSRFMVPHVVMAKVV